MSVTRERIDICLEHDALSHWQGSSSKLNAQGFQFARRPNHGLDTERTV
jgi:hypothetical protein